MMWTDEYDRVEDGRYLHDPGMPLEVWVGELLGPDPVESKVETPMLEVFPAAKKAISKWSEVGQWEEKKSYWHKGEEGWKEELNPWHPSNVALHKKLKEEALKAAKSPLFGPGAGADKIVQFAKYADPVLDVATIKQAVEYLKTAPKFYADDPPVSSLPVMTMVAAKKFVEEHPEVDPGWLAAKLAEHGFQVVLEDGETVLKQGVGDKYAKEG